MPVKKFISRDQILAAMRVTKSGHACARHLHINWHTLREYAKLYKTDDGSQTLYEAMKNPTGIGISKFRGNINKQPKLLDIIEGRVPASVTTPERIKHRLIEEGYIKEECAICGFNERRVIDFKMPLLLHHKDGNKTNFMRNNIEVLCMNCFFLRVADPLTKKDIEQVESPLSISKTTEAIKWDLDDYHIQRLKELGLSDVKDDDPYDLVSRI